jgi:phosphatidylserine decarboxylase
MNGVNYMNHREIVAREGWPFIVFFIFLSVILYFTLSYIGLIVGLVLTIFCVYFFRNPERSIADQKGL